MKNEVYLQVKLLRMTNLTYSGHSFTLITKPVEVITPSGAMVEATPGLPPIYGELSQDHL